MAVAVTGKEIYKATAVSNDSTTSNESGTASTIATTSTGPATQSTAGGNCRIVYNNAADRVSSISASSSVGNLLAANLLTDFKTEVWRSNSTSATLTLTWTSTQQLSCVVLPFSNLSSTATMRVQGYTNASDSSASSDTGNVLCCPVSLGFTAPWATAGANSFAYGGGVYAAIWFAPVSVQKIVVTVTDTSNPSGYIEAARIVTGLYWSPQRNVEADSLKVTVQEDTKHERSDAGSLFTDVGPMYKSISIDLDVMTTADRNEVWKILRGNGMSRAVFMSVTPENSDAYEEQLYCIYGRLSTNSAIQYKFLGMSASSMQITEI